MLPLLACSDSEEPVQARLMMVVPFPVGVKAGAKPGGTPGAPASQPGAEGESVLSKILPGGAAEQAGKLTEGNQCLWPGPWWAVLTGPTVAEFGSGEWFRAGPPGHGPAQGHTCCCLVILKAVPAPQAKLGFAPNGLD